jgi:polysaccharide pyruvyl transferase WcaK-like protein
MRVGILTMSRAHNYGAELQAYSLKCAINKLGDNAEFINYSSQSQQIMYGIFARGARLYSITKNVQNIIHIKKRMKNYRCSMQFGNKYLDNNKDIIKTIQELEKDCNKYDLIIVGSDQMWNTKLSDYDINNFMPFKTTCNKIALSVSLGDEIPFTNLNEMKFLELIRDFKSISVRERSSSDYLCSKGISCIATVDPCFLLIKDEWMRFIKKESRNDPADGIMFYSVLPKLKGYKTVKKIGKIMRLPVYDSFMDPRTEFTGFRRIYDAGPRGFLYNIAHANTVCTDSYHGTVFSIILEKPFIALFQDGADNSEKSARRWDLLHDLGLESRIITPSTIEKIYEMGTIDYNKVRGKLVYARNDLMVYLKKALLH